MVLPNFIICGTQKGGTTALYYYLKEHPEIYLSPKKEVHYFDLNYHHGIKWYEKHFENVSSKHKAIGEASPFYMYLEEVPERIYEILPDIKLIFILRNPVDRAYSHYWHEVKLGYEYLSFEEAIKREKERLSRGDIFSKQHYSYIDRGKYVIQLKRYMKYFSKEQMLILVSEDLNKNPKHILKKVFEFLEVNDDYVPSNLHIRFYRGKQPKIWGLQRLKTKVPFTLSRHIGKLIDFINLKEGYPPMRSSTRKNLFNIFQRYNDELQMLLKKNLDTWFKNVGSL